MRVYLSGGSGKFAALLQSGETRIRTGDTTIFSRVLYQLSYLAVIGDPSAERRIYASEPVPR
jgi:hypothetical protein